MSVDCPPPSITYVDGGFGYNNPCELAREEARRIWPDCKEFGLISIGTGQGKANSIKLTENAITNREARRALLSDMQSYLPERVRRLWSTTKNLPVGAKALIKMAGALAQLATDSEEVHQRLQREFQLAPEMERQLTYFRFNVPRDVGDIGLGDSKKISELAAHTCNYMKEAEAEKLRRLCVQYLSKQPSRT
jgi:hypothetical protein